MYRVDLYVKKVSANKGGDNLVKWIQKGFMTFFILSLLLYSAIMIATKHSAEYLGMKDLFHVIPMFVFNEVVEKMISSASFPDGLYLIPIAVSDGMIGAFIGLLCALIFPHRKAKFYFSILVSSFILFQLVIFYLVPPFMP
jgi:hypothetical protein